MKGKKLALTLGFSHPLELDPPEGITIECPSATQIVVSGPNNEHVGEFAAKIRGYRLPEPYKGKVSAMLANMYVVKPVKQARRNN